MITGAFKWIETRLDEGAWFRRGLAVTTVVLTFQLTTWAARFAEHAMEAKADLMATAAVIGAVAGVPLALLTMLFNRYAESRSPT